MPSEITVRVNGEYRTCSHDIKLPDFLENLGFHLRLVAVEYNGEILHRQFWPETKVQEGDKIEVVTIVGGG